MGLEILDALKACEHDEAVRVVVLTGAGRSFCAGDDLKGMTESGLLASMAGAYRVITNVGAGSAPRG